MNEAKQSLRQIFLARRRALSASDRAMQSEALCARLEAFLPQTQWIVSYASDGFEPDLSAFHRKALEQGKHLYFPRLEADGEYRTARVDSLEKGWKQGAYGLAEPDESCPVRNDAETDGAVGLWLIPGVAFSREGVRLGRGKAVYDRLLARSGALRVGVFYDCQEADAIPSEAHDALLDCAVTGKQVFTFHSGRNTSNTTLRGDLKR